MQATIIRVYPITVSPVMEVQLNSQTENKRVILKLFDHRFGELRKRHPYNEAVEATWRAFIRSGEARTLLGELQSEDEHIRNERLGINEESDSEEEEDSDDDDDDDEVSIAEEEALIFHRTRKFYRDEVRAYTKLRAQQGRSIPKFMDSFILPFTDAPSDLPEEYFHAPGVLLEFVLGFPMTELPLQLPDQPELWGEIARSAIIAVKEINAAGVVHDDCQPRNILVTETDEGKFRPCLIDFGQSSFKEDWKDTDDEFDSRGGPFSCTSWTIMGRLLCS